MLVNKYNYYPSSTTIKVRHGKSGLDKKEVHWEVEIFGKTYTDFVTVDNTPEALAAASVEMMKQATEVIKEILQYYQEERDQ